MKKVYITTTAKRGAQKDKVRDKALEALSHVDLIEKAEGTVGIFGKLTRRDYKAERES